MSCKKQTYSDGSTYCNRCQMCWDMDEETPECLTDKEIGARVFRELKRDLDL